MINYNIFKDTERNRIKHEMELSETFDPCIFYLNILPFYGLRIIKEYWFNEGMTLKQSLVFCNIYQDEDRYFYGLIVLRGGFSKEDFPLENEYTSAIEENGIVHFFKADRRTGVTWCYDNGYFTSSGCEGHLYDNNYFSANEMRRLVYKNLSIDATDPATNTCKMFLSGQVKPSQQDKLLKQYCIDNYLDINSIIRKMKRWRKTMLKNLEYISKISGADYEEEKNK